MKRRLLHRKDDIKISFTNIGEISTGLPNAPRGVYVKSDGTRAFVLNYTNSNIYVYDFGTPHDITTATYSATYAFGIANCFGLHFSNDGLNVFSQNLSAGRLYRCALATPFDLSTKGAVQSSIDYPNYLYYFGLETSPSGNKIYSNIVSSSYNNINRYDMSVNNDITTSTYVENYNVLSYWFRFINSGNYMLTCTDIKMSLYELTTPYDLNTRVLRKQSNTPVSFQYGNIGNETNIYTIVDPNGTKMLRQYQLSIIGI